MADLTGVFDNGIVNLSAQRTINSGFSAQTFQNAGTDNSFSLDPTDTQDFYRLRLSRRSSVILSLTNLSANADLALLDSAGSAFVTSENGGTMSDAVISEELAPGDYYIRVYLPDTSTPSANYTLNVNTISTTRADLLWRSSVTGQNVVWFMNGLSRASFVVSSTLNDPNWSLETVGDMDGDTQPDWIWRNYATGQITTWLMDGASYRTFQFLPTNPDLAFRIEGIADFNGDGKNDIVWRNATSGLTTVWLMNGVFYSTFLVLAGAPDATWSIGAVGDFNADNKPDIVWRNTINGVNTIWLMNGLSYSNFVQLPTITDQNWQFVGAGDFTGDGRTDIALRNNATGDNLVWQMNGTSWVTFLPLPPVIGSSWNIAGVVNVPPIVDLAGNSMNTAFRVGNLNTSGSYNDDIGGPSDRNDYYRFDITATSVLNLSLRGLTAEADLQLLQDLNGNGIIDQQSEILLTSAELGNVDEVIANRALIPGTYFVRVYSPSPTAQATNYSVNFNVVPAQQIDLRVPPITSPVPFRITQTNNNALPSQVSVIPGNSGYLSSIRIQYQIQNSSIANANAGPFRARFYLSRDNVITTSDLVLGNVDQLGNSDADVVVNSLTANQTISGARDVALPASTNPWWGGDQTYYIGMIIDVNGQVAESNEVNNTAAAAITIKDTVTPDIVGGGLNVIQPTTIQPGQVVQVTGTIRNTGNVTTGTGFDVIFYLSSDDIIDDSDAIIGFASFNSAIAARGSIPFDSRNVGTGQPFTSALTLPRLQDWEGWRGNGRYYIAMWIDPLGFVAESSGGEENNKNYGRLINQYIDYNFFEIR